MRVLLGVTGSVAAVRMEALGKAILAAGHELQIVMTESATYFADPESNQRDCEHFETETVTTISRSEWSRVKIWLDKDEWFRRGNNDVMPRYEKNDEIPHIELRKWADVLVVAPLTANTLTKFAVGICDNLLTNLFYAWDPNKPIVLAPAMNTLMWNNSLTREHLSKLMRRTDFNWSLTLVSPQVKTLACGDTGMGAMADIDTIISAINRLDKTKDTSAPK